MKQFIKQLTPPIVWNSLRNILVTEKKSFTYKGVYSTFTEVFNAHKLSTNYNSSESIQVSFRHAQETLDNYSNGLIPTIAHENARINLLPAIISSLPLKSDGPLKILDIGGDFAISYIALKYSCNHLALDYHIQELEEVVQLAKPLFKDFSDLKFLTEAPEASSRFDAVLFSSSLQYFEKFQQALEKSCHYSPKYIILTDHPMGSIDSFVCAQVNMANRVIPSNVFNLDEIISIMEKNNYSLVLKSVNYHPYHSFINYEAEYKNIRHYNLVFVTRDLTLQHINED